MGDAHQLDQVLVALFTFREEDEVKLVSVAAWVALGPASRRDVHLAPHDGFDPGTLCLAIEGDVTIHHAVVGDGERGHVEVGGAADEIGYPACTVEQTVLGMNVKMHESG